MALSPINKLIKIRKRPETTLQLLKAIKDPVDTVITYVFTPSIKEQVENILEAVRDGTGGGYWVLSEYGGGKTHFLATIASLLSAAARVRDCIGDKDIRQDMNLVRNCKLLPVAFSLIGKSNVIDKPHALYSVLEDEIERSAKMHLGRPLNITLISEVSRWWDNLESPIKEAISRKCEEMYGVPPDHIKRDSPQEWVDCVQKSTLKLNISMPLQASPLERLKNIYKQVVNSETGYTGILLIIDEFGSWQDAHPEGGTAYSEDESLLQTLAETLPRDEGLVVFTIVASQKPMPRKFQGSRFKEVDVLRMAEDETRTSREYEMVVAERVRQLDEDRSPEIEEYYEIYRRRFAFARGLSLQEFRSIFPVQPFCFDILRRITANLATARIGINVLWDVLGQDDNREPKVHPRVSAMTRLVTASDLMESANLSEALTSVTYAEAHKAYQQAMARLERLGMDSRDELPLARAIVRTMFLWHVARAGQLPMRLQEMAEAVVADEGMFERPEDSILSVVALMEDMPQIKYDKTKQEFTFRAEVITGKPVSEILEQYKARYTDAHSLEQRWRDYLTNSILSDGRQTAIFDKLQPNKVGKAVAVFLGIEYSGEEMTEGDWSSHLGRTLDFDQHFRVVYMLRHAVVTPDALSDERILVCIPEELSDQHKETLRQLLALDKMEEEYRHRQDDEALRVREFHRNRSKDFITALLNAQRDIFRKGSVITKANLSMDTEAVFSRSDRLNVLLENLFAISFKDRPIGTFKGNRTIKMSTDVGNIFSSLWDASASGKVRDAMDNFAVGLGLALLENPRRFDPSSCGTFNIIRDMYQEAKNQGRYLQIKPLYEALGRVGVPARLATLYLLCFVRRAQEGVEITLKDGHRVRLQNGQQPPGARITSNLVRNIEWNNAWADGISTFDLLATRSGRIWNDSLTWTRKVALDLKTATEPSDVEAQQERLVKSLVSLSEKVKEATIGMATLKEKVGGNTPPELLKTLQVVEEISRSASFEEFMDASEKQYASPDEFGDIVSNVNRLHQLAQAAGAIAGIYSYLSSIPQGRLEGNLDIDRKALLEQIDLTKLAQDPGLWPPIESNFQRWKRQYQIKYRKFHRDYHEEISKTDLRRSEAEKKLQALGHLEQVPGLATENKSSGFRSSLQAIFGRLNKCNIAVNDLNLEALPHCNACQVRYGDVIQSNIESFIRQIDRSLDDLLRTFQGQAIQRLLERSNEPGVQEFRHALAVSDREGLVNLLQSPASVTLLQGVLEKGKVKVKRTQIMAKLAEEFPTVSRDQLDVVVQRFKVLVEQSLQEAEQEAGQTAHVEIHLQ